MHFEYRPEIIALSRKSQEQDSDAPHSLLLRHAKSDWPNGVSDHERPLAPRGQRDAPRIGQEIARRGLSPDHAIISTSRRTRETFSFIEPFLDRHTVRYERAIYEAAPEAILRVIRAAEPNAPRSCNDRRA